MCEWKLLFLLSLENKAKNRVFFQVSTQASAVGRVTPPQAALINVILVRETLQ